MGAGDRRADEQQRHHEQVRGLDPDDASPEIRPERHRTAAGPTIPDERQPEHEPAHHEEQEYAGRSVRGDRRQRVEAAGRRG
jgi:hypothetical protein